MTSSNNLKNEDTQNNPSLAKCPHCGIKLSSWEQVLLKVDRALLCKNCWYRIVLDVHDDGGMAETKSKDK